MAAPWVWRSLKIDDNVSGNQWAEAFRQIEVRHVRHDATDRSRGVKLSQCRYDNLGLHAFAEFGIDLTRLHQPIAPDDKFGRHRQRIGLISVIFFEVHARLLVKLLDLVAYPEDQT